MGTVAEWLRSLARFVSCQTCNKHLSQSDLLWMAARAKGTAEGDRTLATSHHGVLLAMEIRTLLSACLVKLLGSEGL